MSKSFKDYFYECAKEWFSVSTFITTKLPVSLWAQISWFFLLGWVLQWCCLVFELRRTIHTAKDVKHAHMSLRTCVRVAFLTHFLPLFSVSYTYTHGQAAMGGGNARNAPNPGLVFWLVPDFMPSPPGSVARPPCARPTGSNTRPGQPSSSSRPIINQQAALQLTSLPPSPHWCRGLLETQRKNIQPHTAACRWGCSGRLWTRKYWWCQLTALCVNTPNHLLSSLMNSLVAIQHEMFNA